MALASPGNRLEVAFHRADDRVYAVHDLQRAAGYSALLGATVFVVTNLLVLATALIGQVLAWRRSRATASSSSG